MNSQSTRSSNSEGIWKCEKCGEEIEEQFTSCWNCQTARKGAPTVSTKPGVSRPSVQQSDTTLSAADSVMGRYRDAYSVANTITLFGSVIKGVGIVLAILTFITVATIGNYMYGGMGTVYIFLGFIMGATIGTVLYLLGILVSAQGQLLKATLDSAVNTSPFLSNDQKASVMSLRFPTLRGAIRHIERRLLGDEEVS